MIHDSFKYGSTFFLKKNESMTHSDLDPLQSIQKKDRQHF